MVGVVRLRVSAPAGTEVTLRHAEMLNPDGTLYRPTCVVRRRWTITSAKAPALRYGKPRFTFHGFRYVEVTGLRW